MISDLTLHLARRADACTIARLSRDRVEQGLGWSWTVPRVLRSMADAQTNVVVACTAAQLLGFGIMKYRDDDAHLLLLAVRAPACRRGVGAALVAWLERSATAAGIGRVVLEARLSNEAARAFYRYVGYREVQTVAGYYQGREAAVRLVKDLWLERPEPG